MPVKCYRNNLSTMKINSNRPTFIKIKTFTKRTTKPKDIEIPTLWIIQKYREKNRVFTSMFFFLIQVYTNILFKKCTNIIYCILYYYLVVNRNYGDNNSERNRRLAVD